jgi:hypothetical protein
MVKTQKLKKFAFASEQEVAAAETCSPVHERESKQQLNPNNG